MALTLEQARAILVRAFELTEEIPPDMAVLIVAIAEMELQRRKKKWWQKLFNL